MRRRKNGKRKKKRRNKEKEAEEVEKGTQKEKKEKKKKKKKEEEERKKEEDEEEEEEKKKEEDDDDDDDDGDHHPYNKEENGDDTRKNEAETDGRRTRISGQVSQHQPLGAPPACQRRSTTTRSGCPGRRAPGPNDHHAMTEMLQIRPQLDAASYSAELAGWSARGGHGRSWERRWVLWSARARRHTDLPSARPQLARSEKKKQ